MFSITNKTMQIWLLSIGILFCGFVFPSTVQAAALTISGSLYSDEGSTPITSSKSIVVAVGTSTLSRHATTSDTSGNWTITIPTGHTIAAGIPLLIFVDGDAVDANLFTKASSSAANITNLHLYQNRVIVSHEGTSGTSTTVTDLSFYDSTDDTDVKYRAISNTLSVNKGTELHVLAGKTFAPGGTVTINGNASSGTDGSLHLGTGATYTAGGNTSVAGHFIASSTAVFTPGPHTLFLTATTSGKKIHAPTGTLGIVQVTGSSSVYTFQNAATTSSLTIWIRSALTAPASTLTVTGDLVVGGTFTHNNSTLVVASSSAQSFIGNFASSTLYDITLRGTGTKQFTPPYKFDETTSSTNIYSLVVDTTNGVLYAGSNNSGIIYRCALSTACDAAGDWTTSYDSAASTIYSLAVDTTNNVLYAGSGSGGIIYRCALSTACDAAVLIGPPPTTVLLQPSTPSPSTPPITCSTPVAAVAASFTAARSPPPVTLVLIGPRPTTVLLQPFILSPLTLLITYSMPVAVVAASSTAARSPPPVTLVLIGPRPTTVLLQPSTPSPSTPPMGCSTLAVAVAASSTAARSPPPVTLVLIGPRPTTVLLQPFILSSLIPPTACSMLDRVVAASSTAARFPRAATLRAIGPLLTIVSPQI
jgi:hypothetical protein